MRVDRERRRIIMSQAEADVFKVGGTAISDEVRDYLTEVGAIFEKPKSDFPMDVATAELHNRFVGVSVVVE